MEEEISINDQQNNSEKLIDLKLVDEWRVWFIKEEYSIKSANTYYSFLQKFVRFTSKINQKEVDKFREVSKGCVSSSALKSFFNFLVLKKGFPMEIRGIVFSRNKNVKKLPNSISELEVKKIVDSAKELKYKIMTWTIFELALRVSEVLKLMWEDFNWTEWLNDPTQYGKVILKDTKRDKSRALPVDPQLMKILYDNHENRTSLGIPIGKLIFEIGGNNTAISFAKEKLKDEVAQYKEEMRLLKYIEYAERTYRRWLYKISEESIGKKINPHVLRHSKAQSLMDKGMSIEAIKEFLGHSDISTTNIYAQASIEKVKRELEAIKNKNAI